MAHARQFQLKILASDMSVKFAPRLLTAKQKKCLSLASDLLIHVETNFFENTVTSDETWVYIYDPETKQP